MEAELEESPDPGGSSLVAWRPRGFVSVLEPVHVFSPRGTARLALGRPETAGKVPHLGEPPLGLPGPLPAPGSGTRPWTVRWWKRIPERLEKPFPQRLQTNGRSPVWILVWIFRAPDWVKHFPHWVQRYGFSPVWVLWWARTPARWGNPLPQ